MDVAEDAETIIENRRDHMASPSSRGIAVIGKPVGRELTRMNTNRAKRF
jgi:hypothetical protein